jgi:outer membrane protein OmpA-like peptidoglycan-associated protein
MNVGVDLRIVDSRSLVVVKTISMQKQITGTEVGAGIFRFFGTELLDVNMGSKNQEPLQLGVRTTIEHGLLELLGAVSGLSPQPCVDYALKGLQTPVKLQAAVDATTAPVLQAVMSASTEPLATNKPVEPVKAAEAAQEASMPVPVNAAQNIGKPGANAAVSIGFEPNKSGLDGSALQALGELGKSLAADTKKSLTIELLTRETENLPSAQRRQLAQDRAKAVSDALIGNGVQSSRIALEWLPDASSAIQRQGAGMQVVARLKVTEAKAGSGW